MTAILCAALGGNYEIIDSLLDHGASLEDTNHVREDERICFFLFAMSLSLERPISIDASDPW